VQRKVVSPNDFTDLGELRNRFRSIRRPLQRHGTAGTTSDLDDLPARLDRHALDRQEESSAALAVRDV
jgi:hypothetical protein